MEITIKGTEVRATSPEGQTAKLAVAELVRWLAPKRLETCGVVVPDGFKAACAQGSVAVWVHQTPPRVWNFKWIAAQSARPYGPGTSYRTIKIALPYLITLAVFEPCEKGQVQLSNRNECFFRAEPLEDLEDTLCYPALLNCSKFEVQEGQPLSWICTQHLDRSSLVAIPDTNRRLRAGFAALMHCLLETGFNHSSEHHELNSWFSESTKVDPRIATVESWQAASEADRLFVLDVPWLPTGLSVLQVVERIFRNARAARESVTTASDIGRLVFHHK